MSKPKCRNCGTQSNVSWTPLPGTIPGAAHAGRWLCGDCLYLEDRPDAPRIDPPLRKNPKRPQREELFGG